MTEVATSYNINVTEVKTNLVEVDGLQSAEVDAIMKAVGDETLWKSMEGINWTDASEDDIMAAAGLNKKAGSPLEVVNPNDPQVIEIGKFAVKKHNPNLVFVKVIGGFKLRVVIGAFYMLMIEAKEGKGTIRGIALVFAPKIGPKKLIYWKN